MAINGKKLLVYAKVDNTYTAIAGTKSDEIQSDVELVEVSSPTSGDWKAYRPGRKEWAVTIGTLVLSEANTADLLKTGTMFQLQFRGTNTTPGVQGNAYLKTCSIKATRGSLVQGTFVFQGTGALEAIPST